MATPTLPSTGSIVDFLKSQGKDSSFSARKTLFNEAGLNKTLGDFEGTPSQNLTLLKRLSSQQQPATTTPATNLTSTPALGTQTSTPAISATTPSTFGAGFSPTPTANALQTFGANLRQTGTVPGANQSLQDIVNRQGVAPQSKAPTPAPQPAPVANTPATATPAAPQTPATQQPATPSVSPASGTGTVAIPEQERDTQTQQTTGGISASTIFPDIFTESTPSEAELINSYLESPEGQLFLERQKLNGMNLEAAAESAKAELESKYQSDLETLENNLAEAGLAFSGIRATKVKALADSLASSLLDVDREFASELLDANLDLREAILKGVADIAKQADAGRKEAIDQLNAIGYAVVNGQLVPTLASQREERALRAEDRAERQFELSERRLQLAEQSASRAEQRFLQEFGEAGRGGFDYVRQLMDLNPNATTAELKAAALENTNLNNTEIDALLALQPLTPNQLIGASQRLVAQQFEEKALSTKSGEVKDAATAAKQSLRASGGLIDVNGRLVSLNPEQLSELESYIDTVTAEEAMNTKKSLK